MRKIFNSNSLIILLILGFAISVKAQKKITFSSKDSLLMSADLYQADTTAPYILLCHQAAFSRGEYMETALKLNKLGFNCLAIDMRSGGDVKGVKNETAIMAKAQSLSTDFIAAEPDILAGIDYLYKISNKPIILFGSSYSASLALKIAASNEKVKAVIAFSPGEYFGNKLNVAEAIKSLKKPAFVTSSKKESQAVTDLLKNVKSDQLMHYIPTKDGIHGSKVLWDSNKDHHEFWLALIPFLQKLK